MVETELTIEEHKKDEFQQVMEHIANGDDFLLSGGAGSGKTYSLVQVIKQVLIDNPISKIACITYTNAAIKEIEERISHKNLNVSTIHDFLWDNIKHFQKELKVTIIHLANDEKVTRVKIDDLESVPDDYFDNREIAVEIQYKEYLRLKDGIISHDELLLIAEFMFKKYSKLCDIVKDRYRFIFIDEYQDTQKEVVEIFLEHFAQSKKHSLIGFFGDAMQSIYDDGIGDINDYKKNGRIKEVKKTQNRRNPQKIITLANKIRTDGIIQVPSMDNGAPNMNKNGGGIKEGKIMFIYSTNEDIALVRQFLTEQHDWDFTNVRGTKELNLTHNLIATKAGFRTLMDIYDKDPVITLRNEISKKIKDKNIFLDENATFEEIVDIIALKNRQGELKKNILLQDPVNSALYDQLRGKLFSDVRKLYFDKDQLIDDKKQDEDDNTKKSSKRDDLIRHLFKIQKNISLYKNKHYNEFLKITDYKKLKSVEDKKILGQNIEKLINAGEKMIGEIIGEANEKGICLIDEKLKKFCSENEYKYNRVKNVKYSEFQNLYAYLEGQTPFSTQHKTKGTEFDNVLVILDNGKWNNYNFEYLFLDSGTTTVLDRTKKIFYVCCTRTKENLAVFYHNPKNVVIDKAKKLFGKENIYSI